MSECVFGDETGRMFIHDNRLCALVTTIPEDHPEWNVWTELGPDEEGELWYSSYDDIEGYTLDAEEFGPFDESDVLTKEQVDAMLAADEHRPCPKGTEGCIWKYDDHDSCETY